MYRLCVLYKFIHLINKPGRKKNIILVEFTESLYKLYFVYIILKSIIGSFIQGFSKF